MSSSSRLQPQVRGGGGGGGGGGRGGGGAKGKSEAASSPKEAFEDLVKLYWSNKPWASFHDNPQATEPGNFARNDELECRFGSRVPLTRIDYHNVATTLKSLGFSFCAAETESRLDECSGVNMLRVNPARRLHSSDEHVPTSQRLEIRSKEVIQEFCKNENVEILLQKYQSHVSCYRKVLFRPSIVDEPAPSDKTETSKMPRTSRTQQADQLKPVLFDDFNFKVAYNVELAVANDELVELYHDSNERFYRYINRVTFTRADLPFRVDLSIVKMAKGVDIRDADLFCADATTSYEIEIEVANDQIGDDARFRVRDWSILLGLFRKTIKYVLMGLQQSQFPISLSEQWIILEEYKALTGTEEFIGPSSCALQREHLFDNSASVPRHAKNQNGLETADGTAEEDESDDEKKKEEEEEEEEESASRKQYRKKNAAQQGSSETSITILRDYSVTDKADGERHLLFVSRSRKIYLIKQSMKVIFTGCVVNEKRFVHTLLDGELILYDTQHVFINLFAAFDIYYLGNAREEKKPISLRAFAFAERMGNGSGGCGGGGGGSSSSDLETTPAIDQITPSTLRKVYRLDILRALMKEMQPISMQHLDISPDSTNSVAITTSCPMMFVCKTFVLSTPTQSIFECCRLVLGTEQLYPTDGLIFTPCHLGVGESREPQVLLKETRRHLYREESGSSDRITGAHNDLDVGQKTVEELEMQEEDASKIIARPVGVAAATAAGRGGAGRGSDGRGSDGRGGPSMLKPRRRWDYSFKWKPAEMNTVDFLVRTKKNDQDEEVVFVDSADGKSKKIITLECGYTKAQEKLDPRSFVLFGMGSFDLGDEVDTRSSFHAHISPLHRQAPLHTRSAFTQSVSHYRVRPFVPTYPYDPDANVVHMELTATVSNKLVMMTESGDHFQDNDVVEFRYVTSLKQWRPIRVRVDKMLNANEKFGNNFTTANNNWKSIHFPVTAQMLSTGAFDMRKFEQDRDQFEDCYYRRASSSPSPSSSSSPSPSPPSWSIQLRGFHNFVKRRLFEAAKRSNTQRHATVLDLACGKAGDLSKWLETGCKFVLGVDVAQDNIVNRHDGAYARYLAQCFEFNHRENRMVKRTQPAKYRNTRCLFLHADASKLLFTGDACFSKEDAEIVNAVFGRDYNTAVLGRDFHHRHLKQIDVSDGFSMVSCQFALHYFFGDTQTLSGFLDNVTKLTKRGGLFFGTCYDGSQVVELLQGRKEVKMMDAANGDKLMWQIKKLYGSSETSIDTPPKTAKSAPKKKKSKGAGGTGATAVEVDEKEDVALLPVDETGVGWKIQVYQDSINQFIDEYLVSFDYFARLMEDRGFLHLTEEELDECGLPTSCGFADVFASYRDQCRSTCAETDWLQISQLNRFFMFRKQ